MKFNQGSIFTYLALNRERRRWMHPGEGEGRRKSFPPGATDDKPGGSEQKTNLVGHSAGDKPAVSAEGAGHSEAVGRNGDRVAVGIVAGARGDHRVGAPIRTDRHRLQVRL